MTIIGVVIGQTMTLLNVLSVLGALNVLNMPNGLNVLDKPKDASLACWALFYSAARNRYHQRYCHQAATTPVCPPLTSTRHSVIHHSA